MASAGWGRRRSRWWLPGLPRPRRCGVGEGRDPIEGMARREIYMWCDQKFWKELWTRFGAPTISVIWLPF